MENPTAIGEQGRSGDPCILVIFGVSGDLTKRKLLPALYNLARKKLLPANFALVGIALDTISEEAFRARVQDDLREFGGAPEVCQFCDWLVQRLFYLSGDFRDPNVFQRLGELLTTLDKKHETHGNYFYYLATLPQFFADIIKHLGAGRADRRIKRPVAQGRD